MAETGCVHLRKIAVLRPCALDRESEAEHLDTAGGRIGTVPRSDVQEILWLKDKVHSFGLTSETDNRKYLYNVERFII